MYVDISWPYGTTSWVFFGEVNQRNQGHTFKIHSWWKNNGSKYHIMVGIAKDIFVIQVFTVASESTFSIARRVISDFRSSLAPKLVKALICMQN